MAPLYKVISNFFGTNILHLLSDLDFSSIALFSHTILFHRILSYLDLTAIFLVPYCHILLCGFAYNLLVRALLECCSVCRQ